MNPVHRKSRTAILLLQNEKISAARITEGSSPQNTPRGRPQKRIHRTKNPQNKHPGHRRETNGLVDVHMQIPLIVQVTTNSLTEHLHVTLISRHGLLLALLKQLLTQINIQGHSPVVRTLS